jgi:hypothetical protein
MDPTIIAAIIGAGATVAAAVIGVRWGEKRGFEKGRSHSILKYMDEHEKHLARGMDAIRRHDYKELEAIATAIVHNAQLWRRVQENFRALLNGLIDDLAGTLDSPWTAQGPLENIIRALHEGYRTRRLAVETELEKSKI